MDGNSFTPYHAKYFAYELTKRYPSNSLEKLSPTLSNAQVDLNPHQIEAALFAFKSPLSKGAILADEVGLGKTIEAGLVLSQKWAERKRKILLILPANLRKQWYTELQEKFFLPSIILETKSFNKLVKDGNLNPFNQENVIVICSYHFARAKSPYIKNTKFDLVVIDEAHRLRNVYKPGNKIANEIKASIQEYPKLLLTATPLQNSLFELFGLTSIIDDHIFGDIESFKANYSNVSREQNINGNVPGSGETDNDMFSDLRERLKPICNRTLRRQVAEYINFRNRNPITQDYSPTDDEIELYNLMSEYLRRDRLYALPYSQRQLMTMILRKLLASSSFAVASTLDKLVFKLNKIIESIKKSDIEAEEDLFSGIEENYEAYSDTADEWIDDEEDDNEKEGGESNKYTSEDIPRIEAEKKDLEHYRDLAKKIFKNSKGDSLLIALEQGFKMATNLGAQKKAIIFTESRITQNYLFGLLSENGYMDKIMLFNGTNNDEKSKEIYSSWLEKNKNSDKITGSKSADFRTALVDYFKNDAEIMVATEAGAEGINLQFCSLVINYDLPWNPQRIEQRIGRCHRYGQKHDVVVVNFVNRRNAADCRVYQLLDEKFQLFRGVFGASDEILGNIESGVGFEKRIAKIYQSCRTEEEINTEFDKLQKEMDESIQEGLKGAKEKLLENFDTDVRDKLKLNYKESQANLEKYEKWLWDVTEFYLGDKAKFDKKEYSFMLKENPFPEEKIDKGPYKVLNYRDRGNIEDAHIYRPGHPLAQRILQNLKSLNLNSSKLIFDYTGYGQLISSIKELVGCSGILKVSELTIDAFEIEDYIILTALTDKGEDIEEDIAKKLFLLNAKILNNNVDITNIGLIQKEYEKIDKIKSEIAERNSKFFDEEMDKLDKWAEDIKNSLEIELKKMDVEIKTLKTQAKINLVLEEKVILQRKIKDKEKKRNETRQKLYHSQDEIDVKKENLLNKIEAQMEQKITMTPIFEIKFEVI